MSLGEDVDQNDGLWSEMGQFANEKRMLKTVRYGAGTKADYELVVVVVVCLVRPR
jgi:hypothetical protein